MTMAAQQRANSRSDYVADGAAVQLREEGWCLLRDVLPSGLITALAEDLDDHFVQTPFCNGNFYGARTKRLGGLLTRSQHAAALVEHHLVQAIVEEILAPWCDTIQLNLTQAIEIHPGALPQLPHRDQDMWRGVQGEVEYLINVMWPLTSFTAANGATLIHARSHGRAALVSDEPEPAFPIECEPGSAMLFLGSTLHGAGGNRTASVRRGIIVSYCLGWLKPYENQWLVYPPAVAGSFSPALAALVGYRQHRPNLGNVEGLCPSTLLSGQPIVGSPPTDALRPDQEMLLAKFVAAQRASDTGVVARERP